MNIEELLREIEAVLRALEHVRRAEVGSVKGYSLGERSGVVRLDIRVGEDTSETWDDVKAAN